MKSYKQVCLALDALNLFACLCVLILSDLTKIQASLLVMVGMIAALMVRYLEHSFDDPTA